MKYVIATILMISLITSTFARSDGGKGQGNKSSQQYNNPSGKENCYYCWKDTSLNYTPSRHKYAKKS